MRFKTLVLGLFALWILVSCLDESQYQIDEVQLNPSLALPLVNGELKIDDFLSDEDSANIKIYPDGLLYLAYEEELEDQSLGQLFSIPDKLVIRSFILPAATLPPSNKDVRTDSISQKVDLGLSPEVLSEVALKSGQLSFTTSVVPANSQLNYEIQVSLPGFVSRTTNQPLKLNARGTGTVALGDYTMKLTNNQFDLKFVLVVKSHSSPITIANGSSVNIQLNFRSLNFGSIKGFFGSQSVALPSQTIELGAFDNAFEGADVSLAQPVVKMTVTNEYGAPCTVNFKKLEARKTGASMAVKLNPPNPIAVAYPTTMGSSAVSTIAVDNTKELLDFAPSQFYYEAEAKVNEGVTSGVNFLTDTSKLKLKLNVEVPFYGHASQIIMRDTVDVDWSDVDDSQIESASLKLKLTNQLPLDGSVQFYLTDANHQLLGSLLPDNQVSILKGSSVNASGDLQTAGVYDGSIALEKTKLDRLFESKHVIIVATLSTSKDASGNFPDVKFKADYTLAIEAGVLANLKLNVKL